jgi:hypothetical protein
MGAGAYKFTDQEIAAYPIESLPEVLRKQKMKYAAGGAGHDPRLLFASFSWSAALPKPAVATAKTDADGRYQLALPAGRFFIYCCAVRIVAGEMEHSIWVQPVTTERLDLTSSNEWSPSAK